MLPTVKVRLADYIFALQRLACEEPSWTGADIQHALEARDSRLPRVFSVYEFERDNAGGFTARIAISQNLTGDAWVAPITHRTAAGSLDFEVGPLAAVESVDTVRDANPGWVRRPAGAKRGCAT